MHVIIILANLHEIQPVHSVVKPVEPVPTTFPAKAIAPVIVVEQARVSQPTKAPEKTVMIKEPGVTAAAVGVVSEEPAVRSTRSGSIREATATVSPRTSGTPLLEPTEQVVVRPGRSGSVREQAASIDAAAQVISHVLKVGYRFDVFIIRS